MQPSLCLILMNDTEVGQCIRQCCGIFVIPQPISIVQILRNSKRFIGMYICEDTNRTFLSSQSGKNSSSLKGQEQLQLFKFCCQSWIEEGTSMTSIQYKCCHGINCSKHKGNIFFTFYFWITVLYSDCIASKMLLLFF